MIRQNDPYMVDLQAAQKYLFKKEKNASIGTRR